jgi:hypothetical protein
MRQDIAPGLAQAYTSFVREAHAIDRTGSVRAIRVRQNAATPASMADKTVLPGRKKGAELTQQ